MYNTQRYTLRYTGMYNTLRYTLRYTPLYTRGTPKVYTVIYHPEVHPGV